MSRQGELNLRRIGQTTALVAAVILALLTFSGAHASAVPAGDFPDGLNFGVLANELMLSASNGGNDQQARTADHLGLEKSVAEENGRGWIPARRRRLSRSFRFISSAENG